MPLTSVVSLRPIAATDESFLHTVFLSGRPELTVLPDQLIALQLQAQRSQYDSSYPGHADFVIDIDGVDVGRCWLWRTEAEHRLLDLVVLPDHRGRGVGRSVLTTLVAAAAHADVPLHLSVWSGNEPAIQLYRSFGFEQYDEQHGYLLLQLLPSHPLTADA